MSRYACKGVGCPVRALVDADAPPTCYTCGRPMTVHVEYDAIQRPIRINYASLPAMRDHPAAARMRASCLGWDRRVRAACAGNDLTYARILFAARHLGSRPGSYLDDRPSTIVAKRRMGDDIEAYFPRSVSVSYCDSI